MGGNFQVSKSPVKIESVTEFDKTQANNFSNQTILKNKFEATKLCFEKDTKRYTHDCTTSGNTPTIFASYTNIFPMSYTTDTNTAPQNILEKPTDPTSKSQGYIIDARVIVRDGDSYREYDAKTAITDWQK